MSKKLKAWIIGGTVLFALIAVGLSLIFFNIFGGKIISETEVKDIVLAHAKVDVSRINLMDVRLDQSDWSRVYEVQFTTDGEYYEYEVDAKTGKIRDFDIEGIGRPVPSSPAVNSQENTTGITQGRASELALEKVPGANSSNLWIREDYENGRRVYEGKIIHDGMEYDFDIDAEDGTFLSWEEESMYR